MQGGVTARYRPEFSHWVVTRDGLEFWFSGPSFPVAAFDWTREAGATVRALGDELRREVDTHFEELECDRTTAKIIGIDLTEYPASRTLDVAFGGDATWGDIGINVIVTDGAIVDSYAGD